MTGGTAVEHIPALGFCHQADVAHKAQRAGHAAAGHAALDLERVRAVVHDELFEPVAEVAGLQLAVFAQPAAGADRNVRRTFGNPCAERGDHVVHHVRGDAFEVHALSRGGAQADAGVGLHDLQHAPGHGRGEQPLVHAQP